MNIHDIVIWRCSQSRKNIWSKYAYTILKARAFEITGENLKNDEKFGLQKRMSKIRSRMVSRLFWEETTFAKSSSSRVHWFVSIQIAIWASKFWMMSERDISSFFEQTEVENQ
jgi:hypothetical protein